MMYQLAPLSETATQEHSGYPLRKTIPCLYPDTIALAWDCKMAVGEYKFQADVYKLGLQILPSWNKKGG